METGVREACCVDTEARRRPADVRFTLRDAAVQQNGVPRGLQDVPLLVEGHLQVAQVLPVGVGLHHRDLPAVGRLHHEGIRTCRDLGGGGGAWRPERIQEDETFTKPE